MTDPRPAIPADASEAVEKVASMLGMDAPAPALGERPAANVDTPGTVLGEAVDAARAAAAVPGVEDVHTFGDRLHLRLQEGVRELPGLPAALQAAGVSMIHIKSVIPTLEDVFIGLLEKEKHVY